MALHGIADGNYDVCSNPEFLREGTAVTDFLYPDRIVIGGEAAACIEIMKEVYRPLVEGSYYERPDCVPQPRDSRIPARLIVTSAKSAELIKHASNAYLAMKISFINGVANICEAVGADIEQVCEGIGSDSRIGPGFLKPGIGYGGSCFPKDLKAFRAVAHDTGYEFRLLDEVMRVNGEQRARFVRKLRKVLWTLKGKRLAVWGLSFKGGTDDIRESQAIRIVQAIVKEGCEIVAYDPAAMPRAREVLTSPAIHFTDSAYEAVMGADALVVLTDWEEFASADLERVNRLLKCPIIVDGRNLFSRDLMAANRFIYVSVGRPDVADFAMPMQKAEKMREWRSTGLALKVVTAEVRRTGRTQDGPATSSLNSD